MMNRLILLILIPSLLGLGGCGPGSRVAADPAGPGAGTWRVVAIRPEASGLTSGPPEVTIEVEGEPGYLRATVAVARPGGPGRPERTTPYDVLFPVGARARVVAMLARPADQASPARVVIRVESAGVTSESFVEPAIAPLLAGPAIAMATLCRAGQPLPGGDEVAVARWSAESPPAHGEVTIRLLFSRRPTGPRLKPEGTPPR